MRLFGIEWACTTSRPIYCEFCGKQETPIPHSDGATEMCMCEGSMRDAALQRSRRAKRIMMDREAE